MIATVAGRFCLLTYNMPLIANMPKYWAPGVWWYYICIPDCITLAFFFWTQAHGCLRCWFMSVIHKTCLYSLSAIMIGFRTIWLQKGNDTQEHYCFHCVFVSNLDTIINLIAIIVFCIFDVMCRQLLTSN